MIKWSHETFSNIYPHQTKIRRIFTPLFHASSTAKLCSSSVTTFAYHHHSLTTLSPPHPQPPPPPNTPPYQSLQPLPILPTPHYVPNPLQRPHTTNDPSILHSILQKQARTPRPSFFRVCKKIQKTYNSGDSPVVTHLTTSPPVRCLNRAERTGSLVFNVLWSYVEEMGAKGVYI
jgi:hypothetical protein